MMKSDGAAGGEQIARSHDKVLNELREKGLEMQGSMSSTVKAMGLKLLKITNDGKIDKDDEASITKMFEELHSLWNMIALVAALMVSFAMPAMVDGLDASVNIRPGEEVVDLDHRDWMQLAATFFTGLASMLYIVTILLVVDLIKCVTIGAADQLDKLWNLVRTPWPIMRVVGC